MSKDKTRKLERIVVLCNLVQSWLIMATVTCLFVGGIMYLFNLDAFDPPRYGAASSGKLVYKDTGFFIFVTGLMLLPFSIASTFYDTLIQSRVDMIKLEITDDSVREEVYGNIQSVFKKLEKKYLGADDEDEDNKGGGE